MKHVLIVEAETEHAELLQRALAGAGEPFKVTRVARLDEARKAIDQERPDLALVNHRLPDGLGDQLVEWAANRFPVVLLADHGDERTAVEAIKAGALDYLVKSPQLFTGAVYLVERWLREWHHRRERQRADARLESINQLLATMGPDFTENVNRLITLLGDELGASLTFYSQINGKKLRAVTARGVSGNLALCARCGCAACAEALRHAAGQLQQVQSLQAAPPLETTFVHRAAEHTFISKIIRHQKQPTGMLCLFFQRPCQLNDADQRLLEIFASALGAEENRKRTDDQLHSSDERFRQIVETANEGIWANDEHEQIVFVNQRLATMMGYTPEEMLHRPVTDFIAASELAANERQSQIRRNGETSQYERRLRSKDGREWIGWISACPLFDRERVYRGAFAMVTDINERRQLETQLRQVQKLESVGQLAGGVAHDFNNILAAIMMHLSLLRQTPNLDPETADSLKELELEARRAANLTRQLLMFSRRSVMQVQAVNLNELVQNLLKMLRRLLGENIVMQFDGHDPLPAVEADPGLLEQVLLNLAVNARDAMSRGGCLTITTTVVDMDFEMSKKHSERRLGKFINLAVADTGTGMDEATLKKIFEPFFTTKDIGKGTGLGLPTVYGIVKQHQGWIEVHSEPGRGSIFEVFLPAKENAVPIAQTQVPTAPTPQGRGTILLVEDEDIVRRPLGIYLRKLGYKVIEAANGKQAAALWQQHSVEINLLYTDMVMPEGVTGLELAEQLRNQKPNLAVIVSSGYSTEINEEGIPAAPNFVYLPKPSASGIIAETIRRCIAAS